MRERRRALICAPLLPEYDRESGSRRLFAFVEFLCESGWSVVYAARHAGGAERYVELLRQRGVETFTRLDGELEQAVASGQFDLAIVAFWYIAEQCVPMIRRLSPRTRIAIDSVDLHFVRNARRALHGGGEGQVPGALEPAFASELLRELNAYAAADAVLAVSDKEAALVDDLAGGPGLAFSVPDDEDLGRSSVPFAERNGILFVANFRHPPNVEAAEYLFDEILPRLDGDLLAEHPVVVVGNALDQKLRSYLEASPPNVRMVGWVPSVVPYLERARVSVVPLLHGAGTKRKVIQSLMVGTPTVASSIGVEGLAIEPGRHALVADDPTQFAEGIHRVIRDESLWQQLADAGREHVLARHGRAAVRSRFDEAIRTVLSRQPKKLRLADAALPPLKNASDEYARLVPRFCKAASATLPRGARVAVVSKGDDQLLQLDGLVASHFPRATDGQYAGYYPADSAEAIAQLDRAIDSGIQYLAFPRTAFWWLEHYADLRDHLEHDHHPLPTVEDSCHIFQLHTPSEVRV